MVTPLARDNWSIKHLPSGDFEVVTPSEITGTLENWRYYHSDDVKVVYGKIYGDTKDRLSDGTLIHTSYIIKQEGDIVYTRNSVYKLGKPYEPPAGI
jgi:hypothetical protein